MSDPEDACAPEPVPPRAVVLTEDLFGARREVIIRHGRQEYRLRITKADKLILTK